MTGRLAIVALMLAGLAGPALAQPVPFDMAPERPSEPAPQAAPNAPQAAPAQPQATTPAAPPAVAPEPPAAPTETPAAAPAPPPAAAPAAPQAAATAAPAARPRRFLIPAEEFVLGGEVAERSWAIYLTPEQAASPASLSLGYQSSIFVAPEASRLRVSINGIEVMAERLRSPDDVTEVGAKVPANVLRPGINSVTMAASQRHRTDCTIQSTYDLWTDIDPALTFLAFDDPAAARPTRLDDLRAVGVNSEGRTGFNLVVPALDETTGTPLLVKLSEGLALLAGTPTQAFHIDRESAPKPEPGVQTVVVGTAAELRGVIAEIPEGAASSAIVQFVDDPRFGPGTLVVVGPSWQALEGAVESLVAPVDRPADVPRSVLATQFWHAPDTPFLIDGGHLTLGQVGVATQEFAGRRFRTDFTIGVPSDFYAAAYGEATLLLDAAYSSAVLPGSHIDVYVNDNIAATMPITTGGGSILRHLPIGVTMRHFRPGVNVIAVEAVLLTREDAACAAGATTSDTARFALFDTSEFSVPRFARIGQRPNLSAFAGTGFPYNRTATVPLVVGNDADSLSAATTLLAKLSIGAGRPIPIEMVANPGSIGERDALFVGPVGQMPQGLLGQIGVDETSRTAWGEAVAERDAMPRPDTEATFDRWRDELKGRGWRGQVSVLEDWLTRNFDISLSSLRITPSDTADFLPGGEATLLLAQGSSPGFGGTWTVLAAPSATELSASMRVLAGQELWRRLDGRIATLEGATGEITNVPVSRVAFFETQPFSLANYRMIAANWLSANILSYSASLFALCTMLGVATSALLTTLGRRN